MYCKREKEKQQQINKQFSKKININAMVKDYSLRNYLANEVHIV